MHFPSYRTSIYLIVLYLVFQAQFLIFEKIREEGYGIGVEDVRLTVEIVVPSTQVSIAFICDFLLSSISGVITLNEIKCPCHG